MHEETALQRYESRERDRVIAEGLLGYRWAEGTSILTGTKYLIKPNVNYDNSRSLTPEEAESMPLFSNWDAYLPEWYDRDGNVTGEVFNVLTEALKRWPEGALTREGGDTDLFACWFYITENGQYIGQVSAESTDPVEAVLMAVYRALQAIEKGSAGEADPDTEAYPELDTNGDGL